MRVAYRPISFVPTRTFTVSAQQHKIVPEPVKDAAKAVDRTISKAAIKGLEGVEKVNEVAKDVGEKVGLKAEQAANDAEVEGKAMGTKDKVKGEQAKDEAKAGVRDAADKVKDATR